MYSVHISSHAERDIRRLERQIKNRIVTAALGLAADPRPAGCLKVKGEAAYGAYESATTASATRLTTRHAKSLIVKVAHRSEFYD
jgi:hypothetical protein